jgi:hypothetical protein
MPYFITGKNAECDGWAVVDGGDGFYGCHTTKASAIKQAVAISIIRIIPLTTSHNHKHHNMQTIGHNP